MNQQQVRLEIPTRVVEIAINRVNQVLQTELGLNLIEAAFILGEAKTHLEKISGVTLTHSVLVPDEKPSEEN